LVYLDTQPAGGAADLPQVRLYTYCRYTRVAVRSGTDSRFAPVIEASEGGVETIRSQAAVSDDGKTIEIDVNNAHRVADPESCVPEPASTQRLWATLEAADGSRSCRFSILLIAPPYRWVDVAFSVDAGGRGSFEYSQDINVNTDPPSINTPRDGAVYFTLTGAEFCDEPFDFVVESSDRCIIDVGTNKREAILTDRYADPKERKATGHYFYIQVIDESGRFFRSEDPTIVNVDPSEAPPY
jgi:hypothetical protein